MAKPSRNYVLLAFAALLVCGFGNHSNSAWQEKKGHLPGCLGRPKRAVHALNRLTFGPRPGEAERVAQVGVDKWIELQLHPEKIDNTVLDSRLASFRTLRMNTREIVENFPNNQIIKQVAEGKASHAA